MKKIKQNKNFLSYTPSGFSPEEYLMHRALEFIEGIKEKMINGAEFEELIPDINAEINYYEERLNINTKYSTSKELDKTLKMIENWEVID